MTFIFCDYKCEAHKCLHHTLIVIEPCQNLGRIFSWYDIFKPPVASAAVRSKQ